MRPAPAGVRDARDPSEVRLVKSECLATCEGCGVLGAAVKHAALGLIK